MIKSIQIRVNNISTGEITKVKVNRFDTVQYLDKYFGIERERHNWVYNQKLLSQVLSFDFYDIKDGSQLYLTCQKRLEKNICLTTQNNNFWNANKYNNINENRIMFQNRRTDMLFNRIEGDVKANQRLSKAFNLLIENDNISKHVNERSLTIIESTANAPSTGNLPVLWESNNDQ